jgi:hypothetical protein
VVIGARIRTSGRHLPGWQRLHNTNQGEQVRSTEHTAKSAVTPKTGRFALLRGLHRVQGSGAPSRGLVAVPLMARSFIVLCWLVILFAFCAAGVARADAPRLILEGSFPTTLPVGVAVTRSSGDVYVAALAAANINKFEASGKLVAPPSPFGSGNFSGAAVNPTNGDVYVLSAVPNGAGNVTIETFDPDTGALVGTPFEVPASSNFFSSYTVVQIGVDSAGNVYVPVVPKNEVVEYSPSGTLLNTFTGGAGAGALKDPTGVAIDSSGNLWVANTGAGDNRIEELSLADTPAAEIRSEGVRAVALDGHGDVFAVVNNMEDSCGSLPAPCSHLVEYDSAGDEVADVGAGSFGSVDNDGLPSMVAVSESSGRAYVTDGEKELVWIYGPPTVPVVGKELTAEVGTSEVKLGALVNPGGVATSYRFEYGTTTAYGNSTPLPEGSVGEGITTATVWAAASELVPGTTYHYRVVATNELGAVYGLDQTFTTLTAEQVACPNEEFRGGFSARLPDCRAYELVTPSFKSSVQFASKLEISGFVASSGNSLSVSTKEPIPGAPTGGNQYVATRGAGGWGLEDVVPPEPYTGVVCVSHNNSIPAWSEELSKVIITLGEDTRASNGVHVNKEACNADGLQIVAGEPVGYQNLLLRDNVTGSYRLINTPPPDITPADAYFRGASADLSHVVFSEEAPLVEGAPYGVEDLYEWDEGLLRLLSVLPDGTPVTGALPEAQPGANAISADGSRILFTSSGNLYVRVDGERTIQVDKSQGPGASGGGSFKAATSDGSNILFLDESKLTPDATAQAGEPDLYECVLPESASKCELVDLSVAKAGEHADVQSVSAFGSQDSSHVYFAAKGVLAQGAVSGQENLYVWNGATTTLIATLAEDERGGGVASPDGTWFEFLSSENLTGYDNTPPGAGPVVEIFLYSAASGRVACASCNPSGEAPILGAGAYLGSLSDGGRLFFDTSEALVPSDTNGSQDVYEYEGGHVYLISSGTSPNESILVGASQSGDDVFFASTQQLVPRDTEEEMQVVYDARVNGGFPEPASPPPCTNADACRTPVSPLPSTYGSPASQTFTGAGNLVPPEAKPKFKPEPKSKPAKCKKSFVKKKGRCVKRSTKAKKSAHANRRTSK